jgi:osmotically-inducible protein OsmY
VPSFPQYLQASAAARRVAGVTSVDNNLEVVLPESNYRDDVKLTTAANNALAAERHRAGQRGGDRGGRQHHP